jgi:hypothetical protein
MELRGKEFGLVLNASGARGFYGEGYWFHRFWKLLGLNYAGSTFVSKTTTLYARRGNMPLLPGTTTPKEKFPSCIIVKPFKGVVLNAVGLSGPGAGVLGGWQPGVLPAGPKMLSFMSAQAHPGQRLAEFRYFAELLKEHYLPQWQDFLDEGLALQINVSCPNVGIDSSRLLSEVDVLLREAKHLDLPILLKVNATFPLHTVTQIAQHPVCDGIICSNTIPWGKLPDRIDWSGLFGSMVSPLDHLGGGGLSGKPLLPLVIEWIRGLRAHGVNKPIIGGGGILSCSDADAVFSAGASAIELGSVSILRPWRVRGIIRHVLDKWGYH